jgi:hypothetical protein
MYRIMKKLFLISLLNIYCITGSCQQIGLFAGYVKNNFYDFTEENPHFKSTYHQGNGRSLAIRLDRLKLIDKVKSDTFQFSLALRITNYTGKIKIVDGGLASGRTLELTSEKYIVSCDITPINVRLYKNLRFSLGAEINYLISHKEEGFQSNWLISGNSLVELKDTTIKFNQPFNFGLNFNIEYNIDIGNHFYLIPLYNFYFGFTNEFYKLNSKVKSYRHCFNVGIAKEL